MNRLCFPTGGLLGAVLLALHSAVAAPTPSAYLDPKKYDGPIRVACVGDSITYGSGVAGRETNSYPAVLGRCLGPRFEVRNFGVSGATLLKQGDKPYWNLPAFQDVSEFQPNAIVLKLGTNDSKPQNWAHKAEFAA